MADDVTTPLNPLVALVEEEEFEKTPFDVNVSQRLREEESSKKVVRTPNWSFGMGLSIVS